MKLLEGVRGCLGSLDGGNLAHGQRRWLGGIGIIGEFHWWSCRVGALHKEVQALKGVQASLTFLLVVWSQTEQKKADTCFHFFFFEVRNWIS